MLKTFPIEFVRQILTQTLYEQHLSNPNYFGGDNQIALSSFYEQLKNQQEVDRFVECFRDLTEQQNRLGLIGNGIILSPENPTITNLYSCLIVPMSWTCSMRCTLFNRDQMLETINNLIGELKGRKVDVAQLNCVDENGNHFTQPFFVGTIGENDGVPQLKAGDYIGVVGNNVSNDASTLYANLISAGVGDFSGDSCWFYVSQSGILKVVLFDTDDSIKLIENDGNYPDVIFPPEHTSFEKYKVSLSFDSLRCDTPTTLNATEYCEISFGGSATLVSSSVRLGNDLTKVAFSKYGIKAETSIVYSQPSVFVLEPLEMPSGSNANTKINQLVSNTFLNNTHTDALSLTLQYTFICDMENDLIKQWFNYARYGTQYIASGTTGFSTMSPNLIYNVIEYWSSWGVFESKQVKAKIVESIDIENTEGDTLTLSLTMQIQGDND